MRPAHPRSRGENRFRCGIDAPLDGSSPLTRGKRGRVDGPRRSGRLIPAHAGKTNFEANAAVDCAAHPRSRGENESATRAGFPSFGSSPLTRGKRGHVARAAGEERLIPAHAGKTRGSPSPRRWREAHPRSRGENPPVTRRSGRCRGSSPLTRGKLCAADRRKKRARLIPAHAGKTHGRGLSLARQAAHPRSRGENSFRCFRSFFSLGSSPLTRGKPLRRRTLRSWLRLIPAHAGKTVWCASPPFLLQAHPRSRGENGMTASVTRLASGSSPLTRGKQNPSYRRTEN